MGDSIPVEDILAEPEEPSFFSTLLSSIQYIPAFIVANGWYILIGGGLAYYVWNKYGAILTPARYSSGRPLSPQELQDFQTKEESRRRYVEQLQERYNKDSAEKAEKDRIKEEEKRKARLAELEQLRKNGSTSGSRLGSSGQVDSNANQPQSSNSSSKKSKTPSLRPEYNPLMGDTSSYGRVCFRPSGGRSGG